MWAKSLLRMLGLRFLTGLQFADVAGGAAGEGAGGTGTQGAGGTGDGAGAGAGAAGADFRTTLPADIKDHPSLKDVKDVSTLAKNYVNAQKLIGADKIPAPKPNWTEAEWNDFFGKVGRPGTIDGYTKPDLRLPEGVKLDEGVIKKAFTIFHKAGLTQSQANEILGFYGGLITDQVKSMHDAKILDVKTNTEVLKAEYKENLDAKVDIARAVVRKFGDEGLSDFLEKSGLGNNASLVKLLVKVGETMMDDSAHGFGGGLEVGDVSKAVEEIKALKLDTNFQKQLMDRSATGHKEAVARWEDLHKRAFPNKEPE